MHLRASMYEISMYPYWRSMYVCMYVCMYVWEWEYLYMYVWVSVAYMYIYTQTSLYSNIKRIEKKSWEG